MSTSERREKVKFTKAGIVDTVDYVAVGRELRQSLQQSQNNYLIGDASEPRVADLEIPAPITLFGESSSPSSTSRVVFQGFSVVIGFFTQDLQLALSEQVDTPSLLLFLFLLFIVWKVASDKFLEWFVSYEKPTSAKKLPYQIEWRDDVINWIYFISYVIVYLLFGYLSRVVFSNATDFGFTFNEIVLLTIIALPFLYDIYRKAYIDIVAHR